MLGELSNALGELVRELDAKDVELTLVGGMGLYLRDLYFDAEGRSPNYPQRPTSRTTQDLDIFLEREILVDPTKAASVRETIDGLEYEVYRRDYQFERPSEEHENQNLKLDLLAAQPEEIERSELRVGRYRVKPPKKKTGLHGYRTPEAAALNRDRIAIPLNDLSGTDFDEEIVYIPSSLNYLTLKMHAFEDQKENEELD